MSIHVCEVLAVNCSGRLFHTCQNTQRHVLQDRKQTTDANQNRIPLN